MGDWNTIITIGREYGAGGRTVAKLLSEGMVFNEISKETGSSSATIGRVNKCLMYGPGGYKAVLERLKEEDD